MKKLRKSDYLLIVGGLVLLAGAIMSIKELEPEANYVLGAGAFIVVIRGLVRTHEKDDKV